jgi:hypothetical protein
MLSQERPTAFGARKSIEPLYFTHLAAYRSRLSPTDSAEEASIDSRQDRPSQDHQGKERPTEGTSFAHNTLANLATSVPVAAPCSGHVLPEPKHSQSASPPTNRRSKLPTPASRASAANPSRLSRGPSDPTAYQSDARRLTRPIYAVCHP